MPRPDTLSRRPLRIAMLVNDFPKLSQTFVLRQITGMLDRGHDVRIFSRNCTGETQLQPEIRKYGLFDRWKIISTRPDRYGAFSKRAGPFLSSVRMRWLSRAKTASAFRRYGVPTGQQLGLLSPWECQYDVVHAHFGPTGRWGLFLREAGMVRGPLTLSIRGYDVPQSRFSPEDMNLWEKAVVIQPSSASLALRLQECGCPAGKCEIVYSGINLKQLPFRQNGTHPGDRPCVVSVGRMVEKKGFTHAIEAVRMLSSRWPQLRYIIAGTGPWMSRLREQAAGAGLAGRVEFPGAVTQERVFELLGKAHVFLAPSVTAANGDVEGDVNTIKEALAIGIPVIATRHGGIPEMVEDTITGKLVPEGDSTALAGALGEMLAHPEKWPALALAGRRKMELLFDEIPILDRLETIYYRVAAQV